MTTKFSRREIIRQAKNLALASPFLSLVACGGGPTQTLTEGTTMGTTYNVKISRLPTGMALKTMQSDIAEILETINIQMSIFRPNSELSRFNEGKADNWVSVSPDTYSVIFEALRVSKMSNGAFDPTIGSLVDLWGFGSSEREANVPASTQIRETRASVGHDHIRVRATPPSLSKNLDTIRIDLGGIAKGFGVDKVAEYLERTGVEYYLVEIGGELRGRGYNNRGEVWRVGIEKPVSAPRTVQRVVRLGGQALATSGDYRIFFEHDGNRYSHILDPQTGKPVEHGLASVTVIAPTTMQADAYATALMVLGPARGFELAEREGLAAFFIAKTENGFKEMISQNFARYLII